MIFSMFSIDNHCKRLCKVCSIYNFIPAHFSPSLQLLLALKSSTLTVYNTLDFTRQTGMVLKSIWSVREISFENDSIIEYLFRVDVFSYKSFILLDLASLNDRITSIFAQKSHSNERCYSRRKDLIGNILWFANLELHSSGILVTNELYF